MREWESNVRKVVPYVPGEQPKDQRAIKLNTNENPYPPSPMVEEALRELAAEPISGFRCPATGGCDCKRAGRETGADLCRCWL